jgi:hypothetical protein
MMVTYDPRAGQYRGDNGQFVGAAVVRDLVDQEIYRTQIRLQAQSRLLAAGVLDLPSWQLSVAGLIKDSHIRMAAFAAGGSEQLTQQQYGAAGYQIKRQFQFLDKFAQDLADGKLSPNQAIQRAGLYAESAKLTFSRVEQLARQGEGFTAGKRLLDAQAKHCPECLEYERREWVSIDDIMPVGINCSCQNHCKCRVVYSRVSLSDRLVA